MAVLGAKYDNQQLSKGTFSAIIYIDGSLVVAEDADGRVIASGVAGTDDTAVIQAVVTTIGYGSIFIKRSNDLANHYHITSTIAANPGVVIYSDGAYLDCTALNDICFNFNTGAYCYNSPNRTGISGFYVLGSASNTGTLFAKINNIERGVIVEDLRTRNVYNVVLIVGACYDAVCRDIRSSAALGTFIHFQYLPGGVLPGYGPNNAIVDHCEASCSSPIGAIGIFIEASDTIYSDGSTADGVTITNSWIEGYAIGIYNQGSGTQINGCSIATAVGTANKGIFVERRVISGNPNFDAGFDSFISNNGISCPIDGYGIYVDCIYSDQHITGNELIGSGSGSTGLYSLHECYFNINGNWFRSCRASISGYVSMAPITGNRFFGAGSGYTGIACDGYYNAVEGNTFYNLEYDINNANFRYSIVSGNVCSIPPKMGFAVTTIVRNNYGYVTETFASSVGTGSEQTIAHGLVDTPRKVSVLPTVRGATVMGVWADATYLYITVTSGKPYKWGAEV